MLKITECGIDYEIEYSNDNVRNVMLRCIERLQARIDSAPVAIMDTRDALGICAPTKDAFPALYALQGHRVRLVVDDMPNVQIEGRCAASSGMMGSTARIRREHDSTKRSIRPTPPGLPEKRKNGTEARHVETHVVAAAGDYRHAEQGVQQECIMLEEWHEN